MRAILVCVDYADLLAVTLPRNRHHFEDVTVVTSRRAADDDVADLCRGLDADCVRTDSFWRGGALFNKWAALEEGLAVMRPEGWTCVMDADVVWPRVLPDYRNRGNLYTPRRRMMVDVDMRAVGDESLWGMYPLHRQEREFAGYTQVFHASDPVLGPLPWHETDWTHAGGADSFFQRRWPEVRKVRPPWECLHLGPAGVNWAGRTSPGPGGRVPPEAPARTRALQDLLQRRRTAPPGTDPFRAERIRPPGLGLSREVPDGVE